MAEFNNKNTFIIEDGTREYHFENKFGETIGEIHFRGGDISILDRYNELLADFDKIVEPLGNVKLKDDGTSSFEADWAVIKSVEAKLIERINAVFDSRDASNLFKNRNAFSTINGEFYVEKVVQALGNVVAQEIAEETEKSKKRLSKYTKDVEKGTDKK